MQFERMLFTRHEPPRSYCYPSALFLFCLALTPAGNAVSPLTPQSALTLRVFVYGFPRLSPWVLQGAETEATRILCPVRLPLEWIDCTSESSGVSCTSPQVPTGVIIRLLPKALPQVSARALGIAGSSWDYATAFIFYDRVLALRNHTRLLPAMLGRVLAHEITHLLLPYEKHSEFGLMRGQWTVEDLEISSASMSLSTRSVQFMQREALRRIASAPAALQK